MVRDYEAEPLTHQEISNCYWYLATDVKGWAITNANVQTSDQVDFTVGEFILGIFPQEQQARKTVDSHNKWYQDKVWKTYEA